MADARPRRLPWMRDAACLEFPQTWWFAGEGRAAQQARVICGRCLVREECLAYAIGANEHHGIWGGFSDRDLQRWRRPQLCPGCHRAITLDEVVRFVVRGIDRRSWICRGCYYRDIQSRKRA